MFDAILLEATEVLLRQQAEIKRLHGIIRWCEARIAGGRASELEAMLQELTPIGMQVGRSPAPDKALTRGGEFAEVAA